MAAIDRAGADWVRRVRKWTQVTLAVVVTGFFVLLLPGGPPFGLPLACLYIVWAVRAGAEHRLSAWLALVSSLALALLGGVGTVLRTSSLLSGEYVPTIDFSIELTVFVLAATVVVLHAVDGRWLLAPAAPLRQ